MKKRFKAVIIEDDDVIYKGRACDLDEIESLVKKMKVKYK